MVQTAMTTAKLARDTSLLRKGWIEKTVNCHHQNPGWTVITLVLFLSAIVIRILAARGDLWLDEIWSLKLLSAINSPLEIVTKLHNDNNHILNSFFLWILRPLNKDFLYRVPAIISGSLSIVLAGYIATFQIDRDKSQSHPKRTLFSIELFLSMILFGFSYFFVLYHSEARGYALAQAFSLLAFGSALRGKLSPESNWAWVYAISMSLALLSHITTLSVFLGIFVWSMMRWKNTLDFNEFSRAFLRWHTIPVATITILYFGFLRDMVVAGGPEENLLTTVSRALDYAIGLPISTPTLVTYAIFLTVMATSGYLFWKNRFDIWIFYLTTIIIAPSLILLFPKTSQFYFERYFLINITFWILLLAYLLSVVWLKGLKGKLTVTLVIALFFAGNLPRIVRLLSEQRGQYLTALRLIIDNTASKKVTIGSDHDVRNALVIDYYSRRLQTGKRITYIPRNAIIEDIPEWFLIHRFEGETPPPSELINSDGSYYRLQKEYPSAPLSGWRWYVYRRI